MCFLRRTSFAAFFYSYSTRFIHKLFVVVVVVIVDFLVVVVVAVVSVVV